MIRHVVHVEGQRIYMDRQSLAMYLGRSVNTVRARCPIDHHRARKAMYDAIACAELLEKIATRRREPVAERAAPRYIIPVGAEVCPPIAESESPSQSSARRDVLRSLPGPTAVAGDSEDPRPVRAVRHHSTLLTDPRGRAHRDDPPGANMTVTVTRDGQSDTFTAGTVDYEGEMAGDQVAVFDRGPNERRYALALYWIDIQP